MRHLTSSSILEAFLFFGANHILILFFLLLLGGPSPAIAQAPHPIKEERAAEDYSFLKDSLPSKGIERLKFIPLHASRTSYLSIGGSFRPRFEHFTNNNWIADNNQNYYSQRLSLHTDWHFGKYLRFFGELYHGYKTDGAVFLQSDDLDWHQGFVEVEVPLAENRVSFRFGRQELKLGAGRLVDLQVGPNIRRSFDLGKLAFTSEQLKVDVFYGKEVQVGFQAFDNAFNFFEEGGGDPQLWGVYTQLSVSQTASNKIDVYYIGFQSEQAAFSDVVGEETRHSIGIRSHGPIGQRFRYNTELIYQFGEIGGNTIQAFNFEADWKYTFGHKKWKPTIGFKLDWSSGDSELGDSNLNSFNPMFVNPSIYSLAGVNTPVNLFSVHPAFIFFPTKQWMVNIEFATFYRSSKQDGFYSPPRFQTRPATGTSDRHIGNTVGLFVKYTYNRYVSFDIRSTYFTAGDFVEQSGASEPIFQFTPTLTLIF
ncbi:MAG: alginate export family protein [Bacteroidota bacterium]